MAVVPLKLTVVAPVNPLPVIATLEPTAPLRGKKLAIVGTASTVNGALVALPATVVTVIGPVIAPAGTTTLI